MAEFEVAGRKCRSGKMPARTQFHVMRRLSPVLPQLERSISIGQKFEAAKVAGLPLTEEMQAELVASGLELVSSLGNLSDENADYIIDKCLDVTQVQQAEFSGKWSPLRGAGGQMFDLDMMSELEIVKEVLQDNYSPFFQGGRDRLSAKAPA